MTRIPLLAASAVLLSLVLAGCAVGGRTEARYPTYAAAAGQVPGWVPTNAVDIMMRSSATAAIVHVSTATSPQGSGCTWTARTGRPAFGDTWAPDSYPSLVIRCGDYEIMPDGDGWFGWTVPR